MHCFLHIFSVEVVHRLILQAHVELPVPLLARLHAQNVVCQGHCYMTWQGIDDAQNVFTFGARILDCDNTEEMQTSRVTSYLSTNLLVSLVTWFITLSQAWLIDPW